MTTKPSTTWVLALVGWVARAVLLVVLTVDDAHHAVTRVHVPGVGTAGSTPGTCTSTAGAQPGGRADQ